MTWTPQQAAARGAAFLDANWPGPAAWYDLLDVESFDIADQCKCTAGQLWGDYFALVAFLRGEQHLTLWQDPAAEVTAWLTAHGFRTPESGPGFDPNALQEH